MSILYHSRTVQKETQHTLSLVAPHLESPMSVLDVGCGDGYLIEELGARTGIAAQGVDIQDFRRHKHTRFSLYDGVRLDFPDASFDLVMLNFVLHHVPEERRLALLREAVRTSKKVVFIAEDTPRNLIDRFFNRRHGEAYRRKIGSHAAFGFLSPTEWQWLFRGMGFNVHRRGLSRFCRSLWQPFARSVFVLQKDRSTASVPGLVVPNAG